MSETSMDSDTGQRWPVIWVGGVHGTSLFDAQMDAWRRSGCAIVEWQELHEDRYRRSRGLARLWFRVRLNCLFPLRLVARMLWGRRAPGTIIVVPSTPFFAPAMIGLLKRKGDRVVQMLYDLYPDALVVAGKIGAGSMLDRMIGRVTALGMRRCDATVFPGARLAAHAAASYGAPRLQAVIPVGTPAGALRRVAPASGRDGAITVLYAGNLGYMHEVETLAAALRRGLPRSLRLVFHASGACYERLRQMAGDWSEDTRARIVLSGSLKSEAWGAAMANAQVGLILFAPGAEKVAFPSKTFSAMAAGQAIVAVSPLESDLADMIKREDCGWVVAPGDSEGLLDALAALVECPDQLARKREASRRAGQQKYDLFQLAGEWSALFSQLSGGGTANNVGPESKIPGGGGAAEGAVSDN